MDARRRSVVDRRWAWMRQVHGAGVLTVAPGRDVAGEEGDALVAPPPPSTRPGGRGLPAGSGVEEAPALAVFTADCAPLALASPEGVMAAVHAGWRGLAAGVVAAAADAMRRAGATTLTGALGPCIHAECYEFGSAELAVVEQAVGGPVGAATRDGRRALDLPAAVQRAADRAGVEVVFISPTCTACSAEHFSHRARKDSGRQALVVWHVA